MSRKPNREESWDSLHDSEISNESNGFDNESNTEEMEGQEFDLPQDASAQRRLALQDRVDVHGFGEIEQFAEALDRLSQRERPARQGTCTYGLTFVREYERIAADIVAQLSESASRSGGHTPTGRSTPRQRQRQVADPKEEVDEELRRWELERQTWHLAGLMLQVQYPDPDAHSHGSQPDERFVRPPPDPPLNAFSSEHDAWRAYLGSSDAAWEQHVVAAWLQDCAEADGPDLRTVVEELERGADRGTGLAAHGWLATKEALKEEKRLRSWPRPLVPDAPGLDRSLVAPAQTGGLVTQLDPDAFSRQDRRLEEADLYFERATWLACWTMIRRGRSWDAIRRWCKKRAEGWRALAVRGDPRFGHDSRETAKQGWQSRSLWRKMCQQAARDGGIDEYEKAVYGLLCGDYGSVERVLTNWNDYLFGFYSCQLIHNFDVWIEHSQAGQSGGKYGTKALVETLDTQFTTGEQAWKDLLAHEDLRQEGQQPLKMLQGTLISKTFPNWIFQQGLRMGHRNSGPHDYVDTHNGAEAITQTFSPDTLRVLTHLILAFGEVGAFAEGSVSTDNIIDAYVTHLGALSKQQLLPLYAHLLSPDGTDLCMARQLPRITDSRERDTMIRLMMQYDMDALSVLRYQLENAVGEAGQTPDSFCTPLSLLDEQGERWYGQPPLSPNFVGEAITEQAFHLINGVEWFLCLEGHYPDTVWALAFAYKHFFRTGQLAAAIHLCERVPLQTVLTKAEPTAGGDVPQAALDEAASVHDLETLAALLEALRAWLGAMEPLRKAQELVEKTGQSPRDPVARERAREERDRHREAHDLVTETMEPLLKEFLEAATDDEEAVQFTAIRNAFLPELAVAYISVLDVDGHLVSRDNLVRCLDVATVAAQQGSALGRALGATKSVARLLEAVARASANIVRAKNAKGKGAKGRAPPNLEIWDVRVPEEEQG